MQLKRIESSEKVPRIKEASTSFSLLPVELVEQIVDQLQEQLWPPVDSAITDWSSYPSVSAQRDLCALSLVSRHLNRIVTPRLLRNIIHDFKSKSFCEVTFDPHRYRWLLPHELPSPSVSQWIRTLYLHDLFRDLDPSLEAKNMAALLENLPAVEVLVATGFCASVLLHTFATYPLGEMDSLKALKISSYALDVKSMLAAFRIFPNLTSLTIDVVNIEGIGTIPSHALPTKHSSISQLDICARLYAPEEYDSLCEVLMYIVPTLKMVHIHGEYSEELHQVVSMFRLSPLQTLLLNFKNKFPERLMSIRIPTLKTLSISTYGYTSPQLWESDLTASVKKLIVNSSGYPIDLHQLHRTVKTPNLQVLQLQSLCKRRDEEEERSWDAQVREWCMKRGVSFVNKNADDNILRPHDDYKYLEPEEY